MVVGRARGGEGQFKAALLASFGRARCGGDGELILLKVSQNLLANFGPILPTQLGPDEWSAEPVQ